MLAVEHPRVAVYAFDPGDMATALMQEAYPGEDVSGLPSPETVAWGYYDAAAAPVLRIRSGDTVVIGTLITSTPARLEGAGVAPADVEPALRAITTTVTDRGPGGHILTGPIYVEEADSGFLTGWSIEIDYNDTTVPTPASFLYFWASRTMNGRYTISGVTTFIGESPTR